MTPESIETYAVYDGDSGEIYHTHQVVNFKGAVRASQHDAETHALSLARKRVTFVNNLKVLCIPNDALRPGIIHAVDLNTSKLIIKERTRANFKPR